MPDTPRLTPAKRRQQAAREQRLAQALRDNLRRRKEQAREQVGAREPRATAPSPDPGEGDEPPS